tara:strand:+ start:173 stop:280 length:108 start_codon:yes stop_codon:yes gene_type:complete
MIPNSYGALIVDRGERGYNTLDVLMGSFYLSTKEI